jgi:hypothetical protein
LVGNRFELEAGTGEGERTFHFLARDRFGDTFDIVAWRRDSIRSLYGAASMLGEENLYRPRLPPFPALRVFRSPLLWLRYRHKGVLVFNLTVARAVLHFEEAIAAEDEAHRRELKKATWQGPRVVNSNSQAGDD